MNDESPLSPDTSPDVEIVRPNRSLLPVLRSRAGYLKRRLSRISLKIWIIAGAVAVGLPIVVLTGLFLQPRSFEYSFADSQNCFFNPVVLPGTLTNNADGLAVTHEPGLIVAGRSLFSTRTCVSQERIPTEGLAQKFEVKSPIFLKKSVTYTVGSLPKITSTLAADEAIPSKGDMSFSLDHPDRTFAYSLALGEHQADCGVQDDGLSCPLAGLPLEQGTTHDYSLNRLLNGQSEEALKGSLKLLDPLELQPESIGQGAVIYEKVTKIVLVANKDISDGGTVELKRKDSGEPLEITYKVEGKALTIEPAAELPREVEFILTVKDAVAADQAFIAAEFKLEFKTSGGPKVQGVSIGTYKISTTAAVVVNFDVAIDDTQKLSDYFSIRTSSVVDSVITVKDKSVTIKPRTPLPTCTGFTVIVNDGVKSTHGVSGASAWRTDSRTICQSVFSIGTSVQGRSISAYKFGNGAGKVVYVGGMHGDERSSVLTLNAWIDELERDATKIPADKTVIVIPNHNPDAYASGSRLNANRVDLNRNFPASDWASGVHIPPHTYLETGGGSQPLSEPESKALADYISGLSPELVLTYHATASSVFANGSGNSAALAGVYAQKSGFSSYDSGHEDQIFGYPTTGEFETWLHDKKGITGLLVELATMGGNEIRIQRPAMWAMLGL